MEKSREDTVAWGLAQEAAHIAKFIKYWQSKGVNYSKVESQGNFNFIDGYLLDDRGIVQGFLEVKSRRIASTQYSTTHLDMLKYNSIIDLSKNVKLPAFLSIQWTDRTGFVNLTKYAHEYTPEVMFKYERTQNRGSTNNKPVMLLEVSKFTWI